MKKQVEQTYKQGRKRLFIRIARLMNYFCFLLLCLNVTFRLLSTFGVYTPDTTLSTSVSASSYLMMTLFQLAFATLLITAELRYKNLLIYIEFLHGRFGKGVFLIMVGVLVFDGTQHNDMAVGILTVLAGIFNLIVSCMRSDDGV